MTTEANLILGKTTCPPVGTDTMIGTKVNHDGLHPYSIAPLALVEKETTFVLPSLFQCLAIRIGNSVKENNILV